MAKRRYTTNQMVAYKTGKAYKLGREGRKINFKSDDMKESFRAGYKADISRYPKI